ncbi:MAG: hypothetical protein A2806_04290 [Candidatus Terrybacteria bacterium RIFCSPHIGHO2_01_FULL_48_17]|uniref:Uncharacterized protein n=1 Tax=Candidatus Terrybacteria bacterium RIFCSPHIGHO2_01_FULL_48_17 TaxID=1802362 RepID=A0A1G2PKK4_9BACT|nr:MAG: hypothetical protein A2806_04290 [Candidatus Terrybacteria bacterium RIFCSPHIGHO2_01_FULL_48_17]OHA53708.1 MAG: hypothetical protein A3A30_05045 [Candidatus Terrybacteria bacterium RIFCSPLOWO2_01_FULL_48_14]
MKNHVTWNVIELTIFEAIRSDLSAARSGIMRGNNLPSQHRIFTALLKAGYLTKTFDPARCWRPMERHCDNEIEASISNTFEEYLAQHKKGVLKIGPDIVRRIYQALAQKGYVRKK